MNNSQKVEQFCKMISSEVKPTEKPSSIDTYDALSQIKRNIDTRRKITEEECKIIVEIAQKMANQNEK